MFRGARRRLAFRYGALFMLVQVAFSVALLLVLAVALRPAFDLAPELSNVEAARQAYGSTLWTIGIALAVTDLVVLSLVAAAAYYLAGRALQPIQEAHERQRRFVADASHDLRNPIAAIRSTAESGLAAGISAQEREDALRSIVESTERLGSLTADLLLMARSEQGLPAAREMLDLSVAAAEVVAQVLASNRRADVALELAPDLMVQADREQVARILANILDNALRYGEGGAVRVRTLAQDGAGVVEVTDEGPGIAAADLDHLFDPFFRVRADTGAPAGNGLGLAIAKELAQRNGGHLSLITRVGEGSTFRLHLPHFR